MLFAASACREPEGTAKAHPRLEVPASPPPAISAAMAPSATAPSAEASAGPSAADSTPRLYAKSRFVWVWPEPSAQKQWIGFLWTGSSVKLKSTVPRPGPGCKTFYEIEPFGFVCVDERKATLDPNDPVYRALAPYAARTDSPEPHRYGESIGLPRYLATPTPELQRRRERDLTAHLLDVERARSGQGVSERLEGIDLSVPALEPMVLPELPSGFFEDRTRLLPRSTVAYSAEAKFGDRAFLLSADYAWVPKDRVKPYPRIGFRGLRLDQDAALPLAFFRGKDRPQYTRGDDGAFKPKGTTFARLSWIGLTGASERQDDERYLETKETGVWIRESDAVVPRPKAKAPWGAPVGKPDDSGRSNGRLWVEVSIDGGWLIAYDGTQPVYVTLMSPGRGGAAAQGENPLDRSATPTGTYSITGKFATATMVAPGEFVHSDVPFAQNVTGPYAIHGAYWHDNWGRPQSGGCINLSPIDAKWLFDFTEPHLPAGWHGIRLMTSRHKPTVVTLHR